MFFFSQQKRCSNCKELGVVSTDAYNHNVATCPRQRATFDTATSNILPAAPEPLMVSDDDDKAEDDTNVNMEEEDEENKVEEEEAQKNEQQQAAPTTTNPRS